MENIQVKPFVWVPVLSTMAIVAWILFCIWFIAIRPLSFQERGIAEARCRQSARELGHIDYRMWDIDRLSKTVSDCKITTPDGAEHLLTFEKVGE